MKIVHISSDFPDELVHSKTCAISTLVGLLPSRFEQFVYSINRITPSPAKFIKLAWGNGNPVAGFRLSDRTLALRYEAPPKGFLMKTLLERMADWICNDIEHRGLRPDLVQGHKLSIEGIIAERVAARLQIPYALTIQGNSDQKIVNARPDLRDTYRRVYRNAAAVFPVSPWALKSLDQLLGRCEDLPRRITLILPCPTTADQICEPRLVGPRLITAFNFDDRRNKNANAIIDAAAKLRTEIQDLDLTIYGGGSAVAAARLTKDCSRYPNVNVTGAIPHERMQSTMNEAGGFVLASHRESFGLVFIEALLAGCPVVYPKDAAIDGYFDDRPFAIPVDSGDRHSIRDGVRHLVVEEASLKRSLAEWQSSGAAKSFQRNHIGRIYADALLQIGQRQV